MSENLTPATRLEKFIAAGGSGGGGLPDPTEADVGDVLTIGSSGPEWNKPKFFSSLTYDNSAAVLLADLLPPGYAEDPGILMVYDGNMWIMCSITNVYVSAGGPPYGLEYTYEPEPGIVQGGYQLIPSMESITYNPPAPSGFGDPLVYATACDGIVYFTLDQYAGSIIAVFPSIPEIVYYDPSSGG